MVKDPRLVTLCNVSASAAAGRQPTPFDKQIPCPATVAVAKVARLAFRLVAVAVPNDPMSRTPRYVVVVFVPVAFVQVIFAPKPAPSVRQIAALPS